MSAVVKMCAIGAVILLYMYLIRWAAPFAWWVFNYMAATNGAAWLFGALVLFALAFFTCRLVHAFVRAVRAL